MENKILCTKCKKYLFFSDFYFDEKTNKIRRPCIYCCRNRYKKKQIPISKIENEIWVDVLNYEGIYQVSNFLRLKSLEREIISKKRTTLRRQERLMNPNLNNTNYFCVSLSKNGKGKNFLFHRVIAMAFIPMVEGKPFINHKDGNTTNNAITNLEWCTQKENVIHGFETGLSKSLFGENHKLAILTESKVLAIRRLHKINPKFSRNNVAKKLNVNNACIGKIIMRRTWNHI